MARSENAFSLGIFDISCIIVYNNAPFIYFIRAAVILQANYQRRIVQSSAHPEGDIIFIMLTQQGILFAISFWGLVGAGRGRSGGSRGKAEDYETEDHGLKFLQKTAVFFNL